MVFSAGPEHVPLGALPATPPVSPSSETLPAPRCSGAAAGYPPVGAAGIKAQFCEKCHRRTTCDNDETRCSPSLLEPSCTSHSLSVESFGFPRLLLASLQEPVQRDGSVCFHRYLWFNEKRCFHFLCVYLRVPWCRGGLCGWAFGDCPLKSVEPLLMVLVEKETNSKETVQWPFILQEEHASLKKIK